MFYYTSGSFASNGETGSVTAKKGQWTYVAMGFGRKETENNKDVYYNRTVYNFQIADFNNSGVYFSYDNITLF